MKTNKMMCFPPAYSSSATGGQSQSQQLGGKVGTHLDGTPVSHGVHSHTPRRTQPGAMQTLSSPQVHIFGVGEKTHADERRMCRPCPDSGPSQQLIFFRINIITKGPWVKQCYLSTCCPVACGILLDAGPETASARGRLARS